MTPSRPPPVEGRPRCFFGISLIDFAMNSGYPKSKPRGSANFLLGSNPNQKDRLPMIQADSVHSTPPTNTSANNPSGPVDPTRRRFLTVAAGGAVAAGASTTAAQAAGSADP